MTKTTLTAEQRTHAQELLDDAALAQEKFWDAIGEAERYLSVVTGEEIEIGGTDDLCGYTVDMALCQIEDTDDEEDN